MGSSKTNGVIFFSFPSVTLSSSGAKRAVMAQIFERLVLAVVDGFKLGSETH